MNFLFFLTLFSLQTHIASGGSEVRFDYSSGKLNLIWKVIKADVESGSIDSEFPVYTTIDAVTGLPAISFLVQSDPGQWTYQFTTDSLTISPYKTGTGDMALMGAEPVSFTEDRPQTPGQPVIRTETFTDLVGGTGYLIRIFPWVAGPDGWIYLQSISATTSDNSLAPAKPVDLLGQLSEKGRKNNPARLNRTTGFDKHANPTLRLTFDGEGIGLITYEDLESRGEQSEFRGKPVGSLRVYSKGNEVPILLKDDGNGIWSPGDRIEFFIEPNLVKLKNKYQDLYYDPYFQGSVYFLTTEPAATGNRLGIVSGEIRETMSLSDERNLIGESFRTTLHLEENKQYHGLGEVDVGEESFIRDHFFWERVGLNQKKSFRAPVYGIDGLSQTPVKISIAMHGLTFTKELPVDREHFVKVDIGDSQDGMALTERIAGKERWSGQTLNIATYQVSPIEFATYMNGQGASVQIQNFDPFNPTRNVARTYAVNWIRIDRKSVV